jgi:hypothetical protein
MIYNAYYREHSRTSLFDVAWIEAETKAEATELITKAVKAKYPQGRVEWVFQADKSPNLIPVKNADGKSCAPSEVY